MFVTTKNINDCYNSAAINKSSVLYVSPKDSIRYIDEAGNKSVDRTNYCLIQTPQTFDLKLLKEAYQTAYITSFTDDASVFEYSGHTISLVLGSYENIKITTPDDLLIAEVIFKQQYKTQQN
jgi:2-C-methyl-D-erythritol 4-phosphate cytidylyltransferase